MFNTNYSNSSDFSTDFRQRTLVLCSRGTTAMFRHVMEDMRTLLPHHKTEAKFEKKNSFRELAEARRAARLSLPD